MSKRGLDNLKKLSALQSTLTSKKTKMQKTAEDFQLSFIAFQCAQQLSSGKRHTVVKGVKLAVEEDHETLNKLKKCPTHRRRGISYYAVVILLHRKYMESDMESMLAAGMGPPHELT
ncbi:hypothetical protein EI94DRAFT_1878471 [Lactarius quietus]|nr:hypothetical protein EI94DRAFT_1878471 [Lactarius quietus]